MIAKRKTNSESFLILLLKLCTL